MQPNQPQPTVRPDMTDFSPPTLISAQDLARALADIERLPITQVRGVLDALGDFTALCLASGHTVRLPGLGDLKPKDRPPRAGRGLNGQPYAIPARRAVNFRPGKSLKDALADLAAADAGHDRSGQG